MGMVETKELFNKILFLLDSMGEVVRMPLEMDMSLRELFLLECRNYLLLLGNSDGNLSTAEVRYMNQLFDEDLPAAVYKSIYDKMGKKAIEDTIPISLVIIKQESETVAESIVGFLELIGKEFIYWDGDTEPNEIKSLALYIVRLKNRLFGKEEDDVELQGVEVEEYFSRLRCRKCGAVGRWRDSTVAPTIAFKVCTVCGDMFGAYLYPDGSVNEQKIREMHAEVSREVREMFSDTRSSAPWDTKYYKSPCPYCGKYTVRAATWDDKQFSAAFWGVFSRKLHCHYKCDNCKEMWE